MQIKKLNLCPWASSSGAYTSEQTTNKRSGQSTSVSQEEANRTGPKKKEKKTLKMLLSFLTVWDGSRSFNRQEGDRAVNCFETPTSEEKDWKN